jgi:hypothetical protein
MKIGLIVVFITIFFAYRHCYQEYFPCINFHFEGEMGIDI